MRSFVLALVVAATAAALSPADAHAQSASSITARDEFHAGQALYEQRRFADALARFEASLAALNSPNTLLYIARCERELGHVGRAFRHFDQAAREANMRRGTEARFQETFLSATTERDLLESRVAYLTVRTATPTHASGPDLTIDGDRVDGVNWGALVAVDPGLVDVTVEVDGFVRRRTLTIATGDTGTWEVHLGAGLEADHQNSQATVTGPATLWTPLRVAGLTVASVGVVSMIVSAMTGAAAQAAYDMIVHDCGLNIRCPPAQAGAVANGEALVTATNVLLGVGIALAVAGGVGMVIPSSDARSSTPRVSMAPVRDGWVLSVGGSF